jgi:hypothetical protein
LSEINPLWRRVATTASLNLHAVQMRRPYVAPQCLLKKGECKGHSSSGTAIALGATSHVLVCCGTSRSNRAEGWNTTTPRGDNEANVLHSQPCSRRKISDRLAVCSPDVRDIDVPDCVLFTGWLCLLQWSESRSLMPDGD